MFESLKQAWRQQNHKAAVEQFQKAALSIFDAAANVPASATPQSLYALTPARKARVEVRLMRKSGAEGFSTLDDLETYIKESKTYQTMFGPDEKKSFDVVFRHLRDDPDCR